MAKCPFCGGNIRKRVRPSSEVYQPEEQEYVTEWYCEKCRRIIGSTETEIPEFIIKEARA